MAGLNPMLILIAGGGLAFLLLIIGAVLTMRANRSLVDQRLEGYFEDDEFAQDATRAEESGVQAHLDRRLEQTSWWEKISRDLARADVRLKPLEYVFVRIGLTALGLLLGYAIGGGSILFTVTGLVLGYYSLGFFLKWRQKRRVRMFNDQLPDLLNLMVNGLRAGYSTLQALEAVSREMPYPVSTEFRRVVQEVQIGIPLEVALDNLLRRIPSDDLDLVITAINIQREVGGNLADVLESISDTIRERVKLKGEIRVLTSQVRFSGTALAIMPILLFFIIYRINPSYMGQMLHPDNPALKPVGYCILGTGLLMIIAGYIAMQKVADIDI